MSGIDRRRFALGGTGLLAAARIGPAFAQPGESATGANVLRIVFEAAETGFRLVDGTTGLRLVGKVRDHHLRFATCVHDARCQRIETVPPTGG